MKSYIIFLNLFVFMVLAGLSCKHTTFQNDKRSKQVILFGAILPLSGDISEYGKRCKNGIDLAMKQINATQDSFEVIVEYQDSKGMPKDGVSAFNKLISTKKEMKAVIGAVSSSVTLSILPIAEQNEIILFSPAASSPNLSGKSKYFFRNWPSDVYEATVISDFAFDTLGKRKISILYVNNDYGTGLRKRFKENFIQKGGVILNEQAYNQNTSDFRAHLAKIKNSKPEAIYLAGYHKEMANATKQIRESGMENIQILGNADYGVDELLEIAGSSAEGAIYATPSYDPSSKIKSMQAFTNIYKESYNSLPSVFEANGYDALKILFNAFTTTDGKTHSAITYIENLKNFEGASRLSTFNEEHDVIRGASIRRVLNLEFVEIVAIKK